MQKYHKFHLVDQSPWPLAVSAALFTTVVGLVLAMHGYANGFNCFIWGLFNTSMSAAFWFRDIIREATFGGHHTVPVQRGLRMGFALFILSEVMFFFSFFWTFFYVSINPAIELGGVWPPPGIIPVRQWGLAAHNTGLLLLSGCTLTWSHYALVAGDKKQSFVALAYTCFLGVWFLQCQLNEFDYGCSYGISDSVYGAVFYLLTGFHGVHVIAGTLFLLVCLGRLRANHFTNKRHIGFLMAIWYWHFVDVVWLMLYLFIYIWGPLSSVTSSLQ